MSIKPLNHHYAFENPASVYDEEAMTALELAGRTAKKVNECVDTVNQLSSKVTQHETNTEIRLDNQDEKLMNYETTLIPRIIEETVTEKVDNGSLDHVIREYAGELNDRVDNLITQIEENGTVPGAEVIDARMAVDGSTYDSVGEAIRKQAGEVKPVRLMPQGGEYKNDKMESAGHLASDAYCTLSGFTIKQVVATGVHSVYYNVKGGQDYLFTCGNQITSNEILNGYVIFMNDAGPVIGGSNLDKFIRLQSSQNWVYRITTPKNCNMIYTRYVAGSPCELWEVNTTTKLEWLQVDGDQVAPGTITPAHICRKPLTWYKPVEYTKALHTYRVHGATIATNTMTGMATLAIVDVVPGEVYRVPLGKDVTGMLQNYFAFDNGTGGGAIPVGDLTKYITTTDKSTYYVTIPEGCVILTVSCDSADEPEITEVIEKVKIPWLKVTADDLGMGAIRTRVYEGFTGKPFNFSGKKVRFYGDSIVAGVASMPDQNGTSEAIVPFPVAFGNTTGASVSYRGLSGATISDIAVLIDEDLPTIEENAYDYIVIAGGVNDWLRSSPLGSWNDGSGNVSHWIGQIVTKLLTVGINANQIIFISPINTTTTTVPAGPSLDEYRRTIFECGFAMYCCNVVDGSTLGFPTTRWEGDAENKFINDMIANTDGIHPTTQGHIFYGRMLASKLM